MTVIPALIAAWGLLASGESPDLVFPEPDPPVVTASSGAEAVVIPLPARLLPGTRMMVRSTEDRRTEDGLTGTDDKTEFEFLLDRGGSVQIDRARAALLPSNDGVLHVVWEGSFELPIDGYERQARAPLRGHALFAAGGGHAVITEDVANGFADRYKASDGRLFIRAGHELRNSRWSLVAESGFSTGTLYSVEHVTPEETVEVDSIHGSVALWAFGLRVANDGRRVGWSLGMVVRQEEWRDDVSSDVQPSLSGRLGDPRVVAIRLALNQGPSIVDIESTFDEGPRLELGIFRESERVRMEVAANGYGRVLLRPALRIRRVWTHLEVSTYGGAIRSVTAGVGFPFGLPKTAP